MSDITDDGELNLTVHQSTDELRHVEYWSAHCIETDDDADMCHRWWLSTTDSGIPLVQAEVIGYGDGRHYVDEADIYVPSEVRDYVIDYFDCETLRYGRDFE